MEQTIKIETQPQRAEGVRSPLLLTAFPERGHAPGLLYQLTRELASILDHDQALQGISEKVKRLANCDDERMLAALVPFVEITLENSRRYHEARRHHLRLQKDLDAAREIQLQLLPCGAWQVPGLEVTAAYSPARELGGDFYDFLRYGNGRLALALGDVSGKGTAAAILASFAIGTLREHAVEHMPLPASMLTMLNRRLGTAHLEARFVALTFAVYDPRERTLKIGNAGGTRPLLSRDQKVMELRVDGIPLGLFPEAEYNVETVPLQVGDVIVFATDGILESENQQQEQFGSERLKRVLSSLPLETRGEDISRAILAATDEFGGAGAPALDDRTLLVLRVTDQTSASAPCRFTGAPRATSASSDRVRQRSCPGSIAHARGATVGG